MIRNKITYKQTDNYIYEAYHKKDKIGELTLLCDEEYFDCRPVLQNIWVNESWQKQGIGTALLKKALKQNVDLLIDNRLHIETDSDDEYGTYLSEEGMRLVLSCAHCGILKPKNFIEPKNMNFSHRNQNATKQVKVPQRSILDFFKANENEANPDRKDTTFVLKFD